MKRTMLFAAALTLSIALSGPAALASEETAAVTQVMMSTFDKPEARLAVDPVVVAGDWAIAGWTQDGRGGRALLKRGAHGWAIHLCAGDALKGADALARIGIPADLAGSLAADLETAEAATDPARVALFASFEGVVEMDAEGHHPSPDAGHGDHASHAH